MLVLITRDIFDSILSGVNNRADICLSVPAFQGEGKCVKEEEQEKACLIFEVQLVLADNTVASTDQNKHTHSSSSQTLQGTRLEVYTTVLLKLNPVL